MVDAGQWSHINIYTDYKWWNVWKRKPGCFWVCTPPGLIHFSIFHHLSPRMSLCINVYHVLSCWTWGCGCREMPICEESIHCGCIPVILSDEYEVAFQHVIAAWHAFVTSWGRGIHVSCIFLLSCSCYRGCYCYWYWPSHCSTDQYCMTLWMLMISRLKIRASISCSGLEEWIKILANRGVAPVQHQTTRVYGWPRALQFFASNSFGSYHGDEGSWPSMLFWIILENVSRSMQFSHVLTMLFQPVWSRHCSYK